MPTLIRSPPFGLPHSFPARCPEQLRDVPGGGFEGIEKRTRRRGFTDVFRLPEYACSSMRSRRPLFPYRKACD